MVRTLAQSRESDIAFLRRLGRAHDALASVKNGKLILSPVGSLTTTTGRTLPPMTVYRRDGDRHSFKIEKPEEATKVEAQWHDRKGAKRQTETHGSGEKKRRLSRVYPSKEAASTAAKAEHGRAARAPKTLDLTLALGRATLYPDQRIAVSGFRADIDATEWLVGEVAHLINASGLTTSLKLETSS